MARNQVCKNYNVISMMMLIVNSRVLEKFQILNMHFRRIKLESKSNILTRNGY